MVEVALLIDGVQIVLVVLVVILEKDASPYVLFRLTQDREPMIEALRDNAEATRLNFESFTSEPRYTDRIMKFYRFFLPNMMYRRPITTVKSPNLGLLYPIVA